MGVRADSIGAPLEIIPRDTDVIRDEQGFAVRMWGHYTVEELRAYVEDLERLNKFYAPKEKQDK